MSSILIHGGNQQERVKTALAHLSKKGVGEGSNLIKVGEEQTKIGIKEIKTLLPHLHVRPARNATVLGSASRGRRAYSVAGGLTSKRRGLAIFEAQRLTIAAQNSLLKTLEEPPAHLMIVLTVPNPKLLLPTVVSRCLMTETRSKRQASVPSSGRGEAGIEEIFSTQGGRRLAIFEEKIGYNQESILAFLDEAENHLKECLNPDTAQLLVKLWKAKKLLRDESANTKLIIDELLFSW